MKNLKKRARILKVAQDIGASYWFIPSLLVIGALILAIITAWIDSKVDILGFPGVSALVDMQPEGANSMMAVLAQSIIGVTGVMFSMTLVAVSFASGNFGPRLIGNFMRDRGNQWSLGILISTFVYCVAILRTVEIGQDGASGSVPHLSLIIAMTLSLTCIFTIVFFIHHVPETINVSRISASLSNRLEQQIRNLIEVQDGSKDAQNWPEGDPQYHLTSDTSGYLQTRDDTDLQTLSDNHGWHIDVHPAVGSFLAEQAKICAVWAKNDLSDDEIAQLKQCFVVGHERTEQQNPTFITQQLVEMIARALSPGVNDPYTAMDCLNRLSAALTVASIYKSGLRHNGQTQVRAPQLDFKTLFDFTFPLCRQYIQPDHLARTHTVQLLETLAEAVQDQHKPIVKAEIDQLRQND